MGRRKFTRADIQRDRALIKHAFDYHFMPRKNVSLFVQRVAEVN